MKIDREQQITVADLEKAIEACSSDKFMQHTFTQNCLMAQFGKRITGNRVVIGSSDDAVSFNYLDDYPLRVTGASDLVRYFDNKHYDSIRQELPRTVEVTWEEHADT